MIGTLGIYSPRETRRGSWHAGVVTYRERLLPAWWTWLLAASLLACLAIAYGAALGAAAGWLVAAAGAALLGWLLWITSPVIRIDQDSLTVGGARLPRTAVAAAEIVDRTRIRELRGPGSDARLYVELRPWSARDGVLVTLDDTADPHPGWLFSSRHPTRVTDALTATM